jgi:hypothetical protein
LESHGVPAIMATQIAPHINAMKGTNQKGPSCVALKGIIGKSVSCEIYEHRPNCCRLFKASFEDGERNLSCEEARNSKGLEALTLASWNQTERIPADAIL